MLLSSYTFSSDPLPPATDADDADVGAWSFGRGRKRQAAVRGRGHQDRPHFVEVASRLAQGGVRPAYTPAVPATAAAAAPGRLRSVGDYVAWLASPERPPGIDPAQGKLTPRRAQRKREQVANLLMACQACLDPLLRERQQQQQQQERRPEGDDDAPMTIRVVDFCSGTGHVGLPLALLHPSIRVLLLDFSPTHIAIARERVRAAGLSGRVECRVASVEDFLGEQEQQQGEEKAKEEDGSGGGVTNDGFARRFHLGIALHACGPATDLSMEAMLRARAAFVLCPCCVGKIQHAPPSLTYPRSHQARQALLPSLTPTNDYAALASAADVSVRNFSAHISSFSSSPAQEGGDADRGDNGHDDHARALGLRQRQRRLCKSFVETDRRLCAAERGYATWLTLLTPRTCTPKNDLLFGYPAEWGKGEGGVGGGAGDGSAAVVVVPPLLESGDPLGPEAAAFDAWFGDARAGEEGEGESESESDEEEVMAPN